MRVKRTVPWNPGAGAHLAGERQREGERGGPGRGVSPNLGLPVVERGGGEEANGGWVGGVSPKSRVSIPLPPVSPPRPRRRFSRESDGSERVGGKSPREKGPSPESRAKSGEKLQPGSGEERPLNPRGYGDGRRACTGSGPLEGTWGGGRSWTSGPLLRGPGPCSLTLVSRTAGFPHA